MKAIVKFSIVFILFQLNGFDNIIQKKKWAKSRKMDSCFNSTEKLLPLLHPGKRVTTHQLEKSLRKMGFRSWKSFLPGIFGTIEPLCNFYFQDTACKNIYFSAWIVYIKIKMKSANFQFLQIPKGNVTIIHAWWTNVKIGKCTLISRFFSFN